MLDQISDPASGTVHWHATARYADGQIQTMAVGNNPLDPSRNGLSLRAHHGSSISLKAKKHPVS